MTKVMHRRGLLTVCTVVLAVFLVASAGCSQQKATCGQDCNKPCCAKAVSGKMVNETCPISGKPVVEGVSIATCCGKTVGFCCKGCIAKWKELSCEEKCKKLGCKEKCDGKCKKAA